MCSSGGLLSVEESRARFRPAAAGEVGELAVIESFYRKHIAGLYRRAFYHGRVEECGTSLNLQFQSLAKAGMRLGYPLHVSSLAGCWHRLQLAQHSEVALRTAGKEIIYLAGLKHPPYLLSDQPFIVAGKRNSWQTGLSKVRSSFNTSMIGWQPDLIEHLELHIFE